METYDTPRLVAISDNGSSGGIESPPLLSTTGDEYDVPVAAGTAAVATLLQNRNSNNNGGNNSNDY